MVVTHHAEKRIRQRSGLCRKAVRRHAENALRKGYALECLKGTLAVWVYSSVRDMETGRMRPIVFGDKLFLFTETDILITVFQIPSHLICDSTDKYIVGKKARKHPRMYGEEEPYDWEDEDADLSASSMRI